MKLITISLALLALVHHGAAADCIRYDNYLQACADQLVASSVCGNDSLWSPGQWQSYKNWHYSSTPDKACKKLVEKEHPGYEDLTTAEPVSGFPGSYWCYYDYNNDGMITNADRTATRAPVDAVLVPSEPCCKLRKSVRGPYSDFGDPTGMAAGKDFTSEQRDDIRWDNADNQGALHSDALDVGIPDYDPLFYSTATARAPDDRGVDDPAYFPIPTGAVAQIDHIIPRIDENGCPCGDNSYRNAEVLSAELNQSLSNSCRDQRRIDLIEHWAGPIPAAAAPSSRIAVPATNAVAATNAVTTSDQSAAGGCTASGGASAFLGFALLGLARVAVAARRRGTARPRRCPGRFASR